jgi:hypothetical protein
MAQQQEPVKRLVAVKLIKPGMDSRQVLARFDAERQALALMDHPHIAQVFDGGETAAGHPYFVMELVKGVPVTDFCDQDHLPIRRRLELFVSVCQAVQHAHLKGVIHRDLKPSNVLVTRHDDRPVVKVIDFGIAKATGQQLTEKTLFTNSGQLVGTPLYMSPEQAQMSGLDIDTRADVYALGVLLYELLTGTTPLDRERLRAVGYDEIRRIIREEDPPRPSTRMSTLGQAATTIGTQRQSDPKRLGQLFRGELDWVVMKALEKDRNRRYETASAFGADVQRYLHDEPVQACPPSGWYRFRKFARRNKAGLAVAGLILFFLVFMGSGVGWALRDRSARRNEVKRQATDALAEADRLRQEEKWSDARNAVKRAQDLLDGAGSGPDLRQQAGELGADLEMAGQLEEARLRRAAVKEGHFDLEASHEAYHTAMTHARSPKIALITGANRGIGLEAARQLARRGFQVVIGARHEDSGRQAAAAPPRRSVCAPGGEPSQCIAGRFGEEPSHPGVASLRRRSVHGSRQRFAESTSTHGSEASGRAAGPGGT